MTTISQNPAPRNPLGRRAYGAHRPMGPQQKARNVAASITQREREGRAWTWADYGLSEDSSQAARVQTELNARVAA